MMMTSTTSVRRADDNRHVVTRPRATDAVGHSLRGVFGGDAGLPDDMVRALHALDRMTPRH